MRQALRCETADCTARASISLVCLQAGRACLPAEVPAAIAPLGFGQVLQEGLFYTICWPPDCEDMMGSKGSILTALL